MFNVSEELAGFIFLVVQK